MADIFRHPASETDWSEKFEFPDGGSVTITPEPGKPLAIKDAIYMLADLQLQILIMMRP